MSFPAREGGKCVFCTFRLSTRLKFSTASPNDVRFFSQVRRLPYGASKLSASEFGKVSNRVMVICSQVKPLIRSQQSRATSGHEKTVIPSRRRAGSRSGTFSVTPIELRAGAKRIISRGETTYGVFGRLMLEEYKNFERYLHGPGKTEYAAWGIHSEETLQERLNDFRVQIESCTLAAENGQINKDENPLFSRFRRAFVVGGLRSLSGDMKFAFIDSVVEDKFSNQDKTNQDKLADIRYPFEWFPATRALQRTIHLHVGPTNSGKTYHALKRLEAADTGIYAGPLRLLAHEVYSRFNAKGKSCALITGEERRIPEDGSMKVASCTVEMVPLNRKVDVAVIDEIQMIGDAERGWAWTQALLGVQADEVHVCGELRTVQLVSDICAAMGDKLVIHKYKRLSPLAVESRSLEGDLTKLRKGDAVILFSRVAIHAMKSDIERITGKRCAIVYGSLPPETRAQQAELFNNPDNDYDFLVASDAVGMGLNLSIKRVIFESLSKHDGTSYRVIQPSEIKQIAGRAGRYKTAHQAVNDDPSNEVDNNPLAPLPLTQKRASSTNGLVTTIERFDLPLVHKAMNLDVEPIKTAGIFPPSSVLYRFASYFPKGTAFSYIVLRLHDMCKLGELFHMCSLKDQVAIADLIEPYDLSAMDRIVFMAAPVALREAGFGAIVQEFAECLASQSGGELLELKTLNLEFIDIDINSYPLGRKVYLRHAETLHKALTLYLWLSYRFYGVFRSQALAFHVKSLVEAKIDQCLDEVAFNPAEKKKLHLRKMKALEKEMAEAEARRQASEGLGLEEETVENEEGVADESAEFAEEENDELDDEEDSSASEANVPIPPEEAAKSESLNA
ncbi:hypothetical protein EG329_006517 [Mollisiaceae sp. DMI_Dod_QoI]|nr:hypothetical protein EG329_006517 [Helotiales sp. DMI_Dod_QoI]